MGSGSGLRDVEVFRAVMTAGSASKAAQVLGISQPAVSQAIARLEATAGLALFARVRGRLHPTQEALALLAEVNRCFVGFDAIQHRLRSLRQFGAGRVRIAALPGLGLSFLPRVLSEMGLSARALVVSLQIMASREVRERLLAQECDLGLMADEVPATGLVHSVFARYHGVVAVPQGHALAARRVVRPADLAAHPLVALNPEDGASLRLDAIFRAHGVTPRVLVHTPYSVSQCELVRQGVGVALVSSVTAVDYADRGVVLRRFSEQLDYISVLAMPPGAVLTEFARQMLAIARTRLEQEQLRLQQLLA
jgi:DNA-binding transcriptional LysR family regulator